MGIAQLFGENFLKKVFPKPLSKTFNMMKIFYVPIETY
jgi:hypothetical protein